MIQKLSFLIAIDAIDDRVDEIGRFLAEDIENIYQNGEDYFKVEYIGRKNHENP